MIKLLPLSLDAGEFPKNHIIAYRLTGQSITWAEILTRLTFWQAELRNIKREKVAVYHSDSVEFLCIVLTLWQMGKIPVIPTNQLRSTLQSVGLETDCFVGEFSEKNNLFPEKITEKNIITEGFENNFSQRTALIMFTSGSTGIPLTVYKTFDQINNELRMLEEHWGRRLKYTITATTVSHHHMYGLPFYLLWPLTTGRAFLNQNIIYLEQLTSIQQLDVTLISSPAHLEHIPDTLDWKKLQKSIRAIFSAGASLSESAVKNNRELMGVSITEIYGSTETGVIAYRDQIKTILWKPLDEIRVRNSDGKLAINSPIAIKGNWFVTEDLCEITSNNQFSLLGRADKIIKVGGKRISITAIESRLSDHPWINKAYVVLLTKRKNRVGAVIQLTSGGNAELVDKGKFIMGKELITSLKNYIEKVAHPRYWRFVSEIPVNQLGKTTLHELEALFDNETRPRLPLILESSVDQESNKYIVEFVVPHDLFYLEGHFPGKPILPGVVQIGWAIHYFRELFGNPGYFTQLEALKFQQVIQPGERISLSMVWDQAKSRLTFYYTSKDCLYASGRVVFTG